MDKIYTCKYFAIWSKYTHVSKSIFTLRSHANSVHIIIFKGTHTCFTADMYMLLMTAAILFVNWSCIWVVSSKTIGTKEQSHECWTDVLKVAIQQNKGNWNKELHMFVLELQMFNTFL